MMSWMLTGEPIDADTAQRAGLVTEVVAHEDLLPRVRAVAAAIAAIHPGAAETTLRLLAGGEGVSLPHALALEAQAGLRWRTDTAEVARRFRSAHDRPGRRTKKRILNFWLAGVALVSVGGKPPSPAIRPTAACVSANRARSDAPMKEQLSASSSAPV
jgi:hypothetical protein